MDNYNDLKQAYLQNVGSKGTHDLFAYVAEYEKMFLKDCSCFSREEINMMLSERKCPTMEDLMPIICVLADYVNFCIKSGKHCKNEYAEFRVFDCIPLLDDGLGEEPKYISPFELKQILRNIQNPRDRFIILAFYEGLGRTGEKAENVCMLNIDDLYPDHVVLHNGDIFPISDELYQTALRSYRFDMESIVKERYVYARKTLCKDTPEDRYNAVLRRIRISIKEACGADRIQTPAKDLPYSALAYHFLCAKKANIGKSYAEICDLEHIRQMLDRYNIEDRRPSRIRGILGRYAGNIE